MIALAKKNLYDEAYDYYNSVDFDLCKAINKYITAGLNGYIEAYYDLAVLYIDNTEELGNDAITNAFDYM